jgi:hypothetical protein
MLSYIIMHHVLIGLLSALTAYLSEEFLIELILTPFEAVCMKWYPPAPHKSELTLAYFNPSCLSLYFPIIVALIVFVMFFVVYYVAFSSLRKKVFGQEI